MSIDVSDTGLIAYCGLYCGGCSRHLKDKCPGCSNNEKAAWCGIRKCCIKNGLKSCADCSFYDDVMKCRLFNNFMSKIFEVIFKSDRKACVEFIKTNGAKAYAYLMSSRKQHTIRKQ